MLYKKIKIITVIIFYISSQSIGWLKPIDTLNFGYGIKSCLEPADTFSFRGGKEKEKKKEEEKKI